jgi:metal-responsive CopG/Arc/MetJ family transcriptional regulator
MRTLIDIPETELAQLNKLSRSRRVSRAELVRSAISQYLESHHAEYAKQAFGLWAGNKVDGLAYQDKMRSEW